MHESDLAESVDTALSSGRRKWLWRGAILVLILLVLSVIPGYLYFAADRHLQEAFDQADHLDPGWRLFELEARRPAIPDGENSALLIMPIRQALPKDWPIWETGAGANASPEERNRLEGLRESFPSLTPPAQLTPAQIEALRAEIARAAPALAVAHKLAGMPRGRHPITYSPDWIGTLLPTLQESRTACRLLEHEALLRAQEGDIAGALADCLGMLNAGRSIGDEFFLIAQLVRMACTTRAVLTLERILAQGQATETDLASLQRQLEDEVAQPLLLMAARGERAGDDLLLAGLQDGSISLNYINWITGVSTGPGGGNALVRMRLMMPGALKEERAELLELMTEYVEITKLPVEQQAARFKEMEASIPRQGPMVRLLAPAMTKVAQSFRRNQAVLRCAVAAIAVERYRLRHGHWPEGVNDLVPDLLRAVPTDPFDGKPLRYREGPEWVAVYSVGPDGVDDGGKIEPQSGDKKGSDLVFRLWPVAKRRQPPEAAKKD
jgi:hypothetical protein